MITFYSADYVLPVTKRKIKNGVVGVDSEGIIREILYPDEIDPSKVTHLNGVLIPGMVNLHCHLELSYLKGKIPRETGLPKFILQVMASRGEDKVIVREAMKKADKYMYEHGIQAVGDHVNTSDTADIKASSKMIYHTFVEVLGMNEGMAQHKIDDAREIEFNFVPQRTSITPHAPYSCSRTLLKKFRTTVGKDNILSMHNQESDEENKMFRYRTGEFISFYEQIGQNIDSFKAQARNSLQSVLSFLPKENKLILVHNTYTSQKDISFVERMNRNVVYCLCPRANLYIENKLPKVNSFYQYGEKIALGTDSLASNENLNILEDLIVLHEANPELNFIETVRWITINGAQALGIDDRIGSIEVGKKPGLVLLKGMDNLELNKEVEIERII